jgi:hypothetical protein
MAHFGRSPLESELINFSALQRQCVDMLPAAMAHESVLGKEVADTRGTTLAHDSNPKSGDG